MKTLLLIFTFAAPVIFSGCATGDSSSASGHKVSGYIDTSYQHQLK